MKKGFSKFLIKKELIKFFLWFRDEGEKHLGKTVEELVDIYLSTR